MKIQTEVDISDFIDKSKISAFQIGIFVLCGVCVMMDGFDTQAMGYVAPAITQEWHIPSTRLGPIFSAGLFGLLIGAMLFSTVADKIGRRPVLVWATFFFSLLTIATALVSSVTGLFVVRFVAGISLGAIMPNAVALVGEYSAQKSRATTMMMVANGFTIGAAFGGFVSAWLIPAFGWRSVFYFGGTAPLAIAATMYFLLPESLPFMAVRRKHVDRIGKLLRRISPTLPDDPAMHYIVKETKQEGIPFIHLFHEGRGTLTVLLWLIYFSNLLNLYFLASWLPTVVKSAGYSTSQAVLVGTTLQVGGMLGTLGLGWLIDRFGYVPVLTTSFALASVSIAQIGRPALALASLFLVVFVAGWGVVGGQSALNAFAATCYPTYLRSTGVGWGLGVGRLGGIVGPVVGGALMSFRWSNRQLFLAAAIPALVSALAMLALRKPADHGVAIWPAK